MQCTSGLNMELLEFWNDDFFAVIHGKYLAAKYFEVTSISPWENNARLSSFYTHFCAMEIFGTVRYRWTWVWLIP